MKKIQNTDLKNKKVLLRADFNVEIDENGNAKEKFKIGATRETLQYIISNGASKVGILSWLGRPEGKIVEKYSLAPLIDDIERELSVKIKFAKNCIGEEVTQKILELSDGEVLLLENVRFHEGEDKNDDFFAESIASNFDIFINDAFSACHRNVASVSGITKFLPSYAGLALQKEIENLDKILENPEKPAVAIIGGAKIETKLPLIKIFESKYERVLVGGMIANEAIDQNQSFSEKVLLPIDFADEQRRDIGEKTIEEFERVISEAKTIVWNGPMGKFEEKPFDTATRRILKAVTESNAFTLIGGGESVQVLEENDLMSKVSFVSTGGGAMLEYLSGNEMPGIESLK